MTYRQLGQGLRGVGDRARLLRRHERRLRRCPTTSSRSPPSTAAIDLGITMLDTSDAYAAGVNEELVGQAIKGRRDKYSHRQSKFGSIRGPGGQRGGRQRQARIMCRSPARRALKRHRDRR